MCYITPVTIIGTWHAFQLLGNSKSHMSEVTRDIHRRYFRILFIGMTVPILSLGVPYLGLEFSLCFNFRFPQALINLAIGCHAAHTTVASISIMMLTPSYRNVFLRCFKRRNRYISPLVANNIRPVIPSAIT
ncbi:unnamed protein product, partial [Mesorhabditis spiculigera]